MNNTPTSFLQYYKQYLGIHRKENIMPNNIVICEQRDKPTNKKYYYPLISCEINNERFISIAPNLYNSFTNFIENKELYGDQDKLAGILEAFFKTVNAGYRIRKMYRMSIECTDCEKICTKRMSDGEIVKLEEARKFLIPKDNDIMSYSKISDIDYSGANIVVWTSPEYRNMGYGKTLVSKTIEMCKQKGLIPIYLVDSDNLPSIKLAEALGFMVMSCELVASIEK